MWQQARRAQERQNRRQNEQLENQRPESNNFGQGGRSRGHRFARGHPRGRGFRGGSPGQHGRGRGDHKGGRGGWQQVEINR